MTIRRIAVVGAGVGGLAAAIGLARQGFAVTVFERGAGPGGKMRPAQVDGRAIDAGPTVFTMRPVFEEIFAEAGADLAERVPMQRAGILARHAWGPGEVLDLYPDIEQSADAIGHFAGAGAARGFLAFAAVAGDVYRTLEKPFLLSESPSLASLIRTTAFGDLWRIRPFSSLWGALGDYFPDPRLRQLFGRYATYCGSSPFLAPATLMLVADVERQGVWLVEGGMRRLASAMAELAAECGAVLRYGCEVARIQVERGRVAAVLLASGERCECDAAVLNADAAALAAGLFGREPAVAGHAPPARSLSAVTWAMVAEVDGFPLARHTVFFSRDYESEFGAIAEGRVPADPTVYVCAEDRDAGGSAPAPIRERLFCLVNAPAIGDASHFGKEAITPCETRMFERFRQSGLNLRRGPQATVTRTPADFHALYPGTGGALYGPATHGWKAAFARPGVRTGIANLYLAGGSVHPGPGVPMAALSGRMAARCIVSDFASTRPYRTAATRGGTSTP